MFIDPITVRAYQPSTEQTPEAIHRAEWARQGRPAKKGPREHRPQPDTEMMLARWFANAGRFVRLA